MFADEESAAYDTILAHLGEEKKLFVLHLQADGDAVASGYMMTRTFGGRCVIPDSLSSSGKRVSEILDFIPAVLCNSHLADAGKVFLLDVSSLARMGDAAELINEPVIIDHHSSGGDCGTPHYFCFPDRCSTAEIVYELIERSGIRADHPLREAAILGILCDTGHLRFANARCLDTLSRIMPSASASPESLMDALEEEMNHGKSIARLKAAQRMRFEKIGKHIVAWSFVSCFEGSACRAMLDTGADAALVASGDRENFRLCGRVKESITGLGLDLGRLFLSLSDRLEGEGGGHAGAAGFSGRGSYRTALSVARKEMLGEIRRILG